MCVAFLENKAKTYVPDLRQFGSYEFGFVRRQRLEVCVKCGKFIDSRYRTILHKSARKIP